MSAAIDFAVRTAAGGRTTGMVGGEDQANFIQVGVGDSISLNISRESVLEYQRVEGDLVMQLADGRTVVLLGWFDAPEGVQNHLYLSSDNEIAEVVLSDSGDGYLVADYGPVSHFDKWSPLDDLRFAEGDPVVASAGATNEPAGMGILAPALIGAGGGGIGAAALGGAALAGGAVLTGGGGGGDGGTGGGTGGGGGGSGGTPGVVTVPGINGTGTSQTVTTNTANPAVEVTGTGQPGDRVTVTVGGVTQTTTITSGGTWSTTFSGTNLPPDGTHQVQAVFSGSTSVTLTGASVLVDMTPPPLAVTEGTGSAGHVENLAAYRDGVTIKGTGEAGASVSVVIEGKTQTATVAADGTWSVTFSQADVEGGERTVPVAISSRDVNGNVTRLPDDTLVLDTVPHTLTIDAVGGDGWVNRVEAGQPVVIGGRTAANAVVTLTIPGVVEGLRVQADGAGRWSHEVAAGRLADGAYAITASTVDAAGNATQTTGQFSVDTQASVSFAATAGHAVLGDGFVNLTESRGAITVTGQAEAGSRAVSVEWLGRSYVATVDASGAWSATLPAGAAGSTSGATTMNVTATDRAGNTATASMGVQVDLEAGLSVGAAPGGGDGILSGAERTAGYTLTGMADANARVFVSYMGQERVAQAGADGRWSLALTANDFASGEVARGAAGGTLSVWSVDAAGNRSETVTRDFAVDTVVRNFSFADPNLMGAVYDGPQDALKLNAAERAAGLVVEGNVEPGSLVRVMVGQTTYIVPPTQTLGGTWSLRILEGALPQGAEQTATIQVQAQDGLGNQSAWVSKTIAIDTVVANFAATDVTFGLGSDRVLNAAEAAAGLPITGKAEAGSVVTVTVDGRRHEVTANAAGDWSTTFTRAELPSGERSVAVQVEAVDPHGNRAAHSLSFDLDTTAPGSPLVLNDAGGGNVINGVFTLNEVAGANDGLTYHSVTRDGVVTNITPTNTSEGAITAHGQSWDSEFALFRAPVADGSYLVIRDLDQAGNESSTLYLRTTTATEVDLSRPGLAGFDIAAVDLSSTQGRLTITEAQLRSITGPDQTLMVRGGADDQVTMVGARATGASHIGADGQHYAVYTLGGATLYVDEDISQRVV